MTELGTKLRDARIEKGYTLNTLQQMTKIQKKYLQAIEEGNFDEMPGSFYVRAFVKQYADMVGLDGDELLSQYGEELIVTNDEKNPNRQEDDIIPSRVERHDTKEKSKIDVMLSYLPLILLITIIFVIIVALVTAINSIRNVEEPEEIVSSETTNVVSVVEPESVASISVESVAPEPEAPVLGENDILVGDKILTLVSEPGDITTFGLNSPFTEYTFEVEGNAFVWVGIFEDGAIVQDITIQDGETLEHTVTPGTQELRIALGYPDGAVFKVNGEEIEPQGELLRETMVFIAGEGIEENAAADETVELELPATENSENAQEETTGFQGPAVLDPANQNDGAN